jgi:hypothetical protein
MKAFIGGSATGYLLGDSQLKLEQPPSVPASVGIENAC